MEMSLEELLASLDAQEVTYAIRSYRRNWARFPHPIGVELFSLRHAESCFRGWGDTPREAVLEAMRRMDAAALVDPSVPGAGMPSPERAER
jgi:hypothetical protein